MPNVESIETILNRNLAREGLPPLGTAPLDVSGEPTVERGFLGQVGAGLVRGPLQAGESIGEAIELVAPDIGQGISDFFKELAPTPSGGVVEEALASAGQSIVTTGALAGIALATPAAAFAVPIAAAGTGAIFGAAEANRTREFLEGINDQLLRRGQPPLSAGDIRQAMILNAGIEGIGEGLANFLLAKAGLKGTRVVGQAKEGIRHLLQSPTMNEALKRTAQATISASKALAVGAAGEAGTEAAQAAGQAGVLQGVVSRRAPETRLQSPGEAALQAAAPAALAGALFGGVEIAGAGIRDVRGRRRAGREIDQLAADVLSRPPAQPQEPSASQVRMEGEGFTTMTHEEAAAAREQRAREGAAEAYRQEPGAAKPSPLASDSRPVTRTDRLATLTPDEFLTATGRESQGLNFREFVSEEFLPHVLEAFQRGLRPMDILDLEARQQYVENLKAALVGFPVEPGLNSFMSDNRFLPVPIEPTSTAVVPVPRRVPPEPSVIEAGPARTAEERRNVERIVTTPEGQAGQVRINQFGVYTFNRIAPTPAGEFPGVSRIEIPDDRFNTMFSRPEEGADPGAIDRVRRDFVARENMDFEALADVALPQARRRRRGQPAATTGSLIPTADRLLNAEQQARAYLQEQVARAERGEQAYRNFERVQPALIRQMRQDNQISEDDAQEIFSRVATEIGEELATRPERPAGRQLEDVEAHPTQEEKELAASDVALNLVVQSIEEEGPFPNRFENRGAFNQRVQFLAELLEAETGLGGTQPLVGEGAPGSGLPAAQMRQLTGAFELISQTVTQIGEEQSAKPTPQEPDASQIRMNDVADDAQRRQRDRVAVDIPDVVDREPPPPRPGEEITPPVKPPPESNVLQRVDDAANQPVTQTEGVDGIVKTVRGRSVEYKYAFVDANRLQTSVDQAGNINPDFPQALQPRDRTSITTQSQINDMINKLDPAQLAESTLANFGAPIVGDDMVVEAGNGRTLALQRMYTLGIHQATDYQAYLHDNAERFGLSRVQLRATQRPMLVRVRRTPMTMEERAAFAIEANERAEQAFSTAEQAAVDARALTREVVALFNPSRSSSARKIVEGIAARQNLPFARAFLQGLPTNDQPGILNNKGEISQNGARRILNAVFMRVYGNNVAFNQLAEDVDDNIANIIQAMTMAMPSMLRMKLEIEEGLLPNLDLDPTGEISAAASKLSTLRQQEETVVNYFNQTNLFGGEELSPVAKDYLKLLDGEGRGFRRLEEVLTAVAERVRQFSTPFMEENNLPPPTKGTLLAAAIEEVERRHGIRINLTGPAGSFEETEGAADLFGTTPSESVSGITREGRQEEGQQPAISQVVEEFNGFTISQVGPPGGEVYQVTDAEGNHILRANSLEGARQRLQDRFPSGPQRFQLTGEPAQTAEVIGDDLLTNLSEAFESRNIAQLDSGELEIKTSRGNVLVRQVNHIAVDSAAVELSYGRPPTRAEIESGAEAAIQYKNGRFELLLTEGVTRATIFHEAGHFFEDSGILTAQNVQTLNSALRRQGLEQTAENRADYLGERLQVRPDNSPIGRIAAKAQRFIDKLMRGLGFETTGQIVRSIQRGDAASVAPSQEGLQRYALRPPRREGQQREFRTITPEIEGKLYRDYANFANMFSPDVLAQFNQEFPKERISIPEMDRESTAIATEWHDNPSQLATQMGRWMKGDGIPTTAQARALMGIAQGMWQDRRNALEAGQINQDQFRAFEQQWFGLNGLLNYAQLAVSEAGRLLRFAQESPPVGAYMVTMNRLKERRDAMTPEQFDVMQQRIIDAFASGDRQALRTLGNQIEPPTLRDYFFEWFYGSVLSSPATFNINLFSTYGFIQFHNAIVRGTTAILDPVVARLQGRAREHYVSEVLPSFAAGFKGIPKGAGRFWSLWRPGKKRQALPAEITKFQRERGSAAGAWERAEHGINVPALGIKKGEPITWMRRMAPVITFATRGLEAADVALRELAFDTELQARAIRASIQQLGRRDTNFETNYINTISDRPAELKAILDIARELTFTDSPGVLARFLIRARNIPVFGPFLHLLMPFAATPERLLRRGWEFVPGGTLIPTLWRGVEFEGYLPRFTQQFKDDPKIAEIFAKQLIGAVMAMSMFALWKAGRLTGDTPDEEAEREAFYRQGKLPFSYESPSGHVIQWRRFEPLSLPLGMAVAAFTAIDKLQKDRAEKGEAIFSRNLVGDVDDTVTWAATAAHAMGHYIIDGSYFRGLAEFMASATQRPSGSIQRGLVRQFVAATVPFSSAQRALIRFQDAVESGEIFIREERTPIQQLQASNFFLPRAPRRVDVTGEPTSQRPIFGAAEAIGFPPLRTSTLTDDPVELALERADYAPGAPSRRDLQRALKRTVDDDEFRAYVIRRGQIARQRIERLVSSPFFDNLPKERQNTRLKAIFRQASRHARREIERASR